MLKYHFLIFFCFPLFVFGQVEHPLWQTGTKWEIQVAEAAALCQYTSGVRWFHEGDTMVAGKQFFKMIGHPIKSRQGAPYCPPYYVDLEETLYGPLVREDQNNGKVWMWLEEEEVLLFDYSLMQGDTFFDNYTTQGLFLKVDSVSTVLDLQSELRKVWYFNNSQFFIEGIGGSQGPFNPLVEGIGFSYVTQCVQTNGLQVWGDQCFGTSNIQSISEENTRISPNPTNGKVAVQSTTFIGQLTVMGADGRVWIEQFNPGRKFDVDLYQVPYGTYYFRLKTGNGVQNLKVVKN
jgi:hypothetical protein